MEIKLRNIINNQNEQLIEENNNFLASLNDLIFEEDILLVDDAKDPLFEIIFVETGGSETQFLKLFDELPRSIVLLSNGKNNSLPASFEIKTYAENHGKIVHLFTGEESFIAQEVEQKFGINLVKITGEALSKEIKKKKYDKVPHLSQLQKKYKDPKILEGALYIYGALKRLMEKYNLSGFTIRCFDLLGEFKNTACLALALLNEEGIVATCEGDVPSMLTMYFVKAITGLNSFQANPSRFDFPNHKLLLSHCTLPLNMVSKYELPTHFESGLGVAIKGEMKLGKCTICKLWPDLNHFTCFVGEIKENLSLPGYCRTQIDVEFDEDDLATLFDENFGNHLIICYGDIANLFIIFMRFMQ